MSFTSFWQCSFFFDFAAAGFLCLRLSCSLLHQISICLQQLPCFDHPWCGRWVDSEWLKLAFCLSVSLKLYLCPRLCAYPSFLIYSDDPPVSLSLSSVWVCLLASRKKATAKMLSRAPQVKSSGSSFQDFRTSLAATCWALLHPADGDIFDESRMNRDILRIMRRQWKKWLKIIENYKII